RKRSAGSRPPSKPPPARHRPGARFARLGDVPPFYRRPTGKRTSESSRVTVTGPSGPPTRGLRFGPRFARVAPTTPKQVGSGKRSPVDGDKHTHSGGDARLLFGCLGRSDRSAQGDRPTLRSIRPKRATLSHAFRNADRLVARRWSGPGERR